MKQIYLAVALFPAILAAQQKPVHAFNVVEATIPEMQTAMQQGRVTSHEIVLQYLARIATYENILRATITVNPRALEEADALDRERAQGRVRGPLHGIPIAVKDNILTNDLPTTGGALAFEGYVPPYDATLVKNLRDAGAIIIAKTNLSELAGWLASAPTPAPGNYTGVHGFGYNPYDPRKDPRPGFNDGRPVLNTGGSSSGAGTAANFWAANIGTETSGSILNPANQSMLAAIKPTVGRVSRWGIIPVTLDQDTAGPMARTMRDAAIVLGAIESAKPDSNDPATTICPPPPNRDYTQFLKPDGLKGMRIGIPRAYFFDANTATTPTTRGGGGFAGTGGGRGGLSPDQAAQMKDAIEILKKQGAIIVDPANLPSVVDRNPDKNVLNFFFCVGVSGFKGRDPNCSSVLKYGMKRDFNAWVATLGPNAPVKSLTELREWNMTHITGGAIRFGQTTLDISDEQDIAADKARYEADRAKDIELAATHGIDEVMKANNLDAIMFPGSSGTTIVDKPGYPSVIVPFALVTSNANPAFPAGFKPKPAPFGVSFAGMACSEPKLIQIGYAFEQASKRRVPPPQFP